MNESEYPPPGMEKRNPDAALGYGILRGQQQKKCHHPVRDNYFLVRSHSFSLLLYIYKPYESSYWKTALHSAGGRRLCATSKEMARHSMRLQRNRPISTINCDTGFQLPSSSASLRLPD